MNLYINVISFTGPINRKRRRSPPSSEADLITNLGNLIEKVVREEPAQIKQLQQVPSGTITVPQLGKFCLGSPRNQPEGRLRSLSLSSHCIPIPFESYQNSSRSILFTSIHFYPTFDY